MHYFLPDKHRKMIRYYGIYTHGIKEKQAEIERKTWALTGLKVKAGFFKASCLVPAGGHPGRTINQDYISDASVRTVYYSAHVSYRMSVEADLHVLCCFDTATSCREPEPGALQGALSVLILEVSYIKNFKISKQLSFQLFPLPLSFS